MRAPAGSRSSTRLTPRGWGLLAAAGALLAAGFAFGYPELAVLGGAAGVAVAVGLGQVLGRPRLTVDRVAEPDRVARGEASTMTLTVGNAGRLRAITVAAEDRCGRERVPVPPLRLRPHRRTTVRYPVPTRRRGLVRIGPLLVTRRDPLGLAAAGHRHGGLATVWVHPRIHPLAAVPAGVSRSLDGRIDRVPPGSITFDTLREYVVGDELRRVHWRTSARVGELMVREHVDTSRPSIVVLLDDRAPAHPEPVDGAAETFEAACEAAASIVTAAVGADLPVTLRLVGGAAATPPRGGAARVALDLLAEAELGQAQGAGSGDPLELATARLRQRRAGDTVVFLTGPGGRGRLGPVGALRGAYPTVVVAVFGAGEPGSPVDAGVVVLDAVDGADFAAQWDGIRAW